MALAGPTGVVLRAELQGERKELGRAGPCLEGNGPRCWAHGGGKRNQDEMVWAEVEFEPALGFCGEREKDWAELG